MLEAVDAIIKKAAGSTLDNAFFSTMADEIGLISSKMKTTPAQSVVLALFMNNVFDDEFNINRVFGKTLCSTTRKLELMNDIDALTESNYINKRKNIDGEILYNIPDDVVKAFQHNTPYIHESYQKMTARSLFYTLEDLFNQRESERISYEKLKGAIRNLFDVNNELAFVSNIRAFAFDEDDEMMLIVFCHLFVNNHDDNIGWEDLKFLYERSHMRYLAHSELMDDTSVLFEKHLIEHTIEDGFANSEHFKLTDKAKRQLLGELKINNTRRNHIYNNTTLCKDIRTKPLYFTAKVEKNVGELKQLLNEKQFKNICRRMKQKGFHSGFACLFYGSPGTGKTETAYQLAKATGRNIMMVDIPQVRSMWVGESEKNVKAIFDQYANLAKNSRRAPILLFNEADAIIGRRTTNINSAVDKMENTMQNIILQEMENFNGILIATTNLQEGLDSAFERRFLYKIQFQQPDTQTRARIWHTMIPELNDETINKLALKYNLSGGQIENIARHYTIQTILKGEQTITLQTLQAFCEQESIRKTKRSIGFEL